MHQLELGVYSCIYPWIYLLLLLFSMNMFLIPGNDIQIELILMCPIQDLSWFCYGLSDVGCANILAGYFHGDAAILCLTHWCRVTHICVGNLIIIGSDNRLSPGQRQAIIWTIAGILVIGPLETSFSEMLIEILTFSFQKCVWKCRLRNGGHFVPASMC